MHSKKLLLIDPGKYINLTINFKVMVYDISEVAYSLVVIQNDDKIIKSYDGFVTEITNNTFGGVENVSITIPNVKVDDNLLRYVARIDTLGSGYINEYYPEGSKVNKDELFDIDPENDEVGIVYIDSENVELNIDPAIDYLFSPLIVRIFTHEPIAYKDFIVRVTGGGSHISSPSNHTSLFSVVNGYYVAKNSEPYAFDITVPYIQTHDILIPNVPIYTNNIQYWINRSWYTMPNPNFEEQEYYPREHFETYLQDYDLWWDIQQLDVSQHEEPIVIEAWTDSTQSDILLEFRTDERMFYVE